MNEIEWKREQNMIVNACRKSLDNGDMDAELQVQLKLFEKSELPTADELERMEREVRGRLGLLG